MTHDAIIWQGITALVTILTVVAGYLKTRTDRRQQHAETVDRLATVQKTVNGQNEALAARVEQLSATLAAHGVELPPPQSKAG